MTLTNNEVQKGNSDTPVCTCPNCGKFCSPNTGWQVKVFTNVILFCSEECYKKYDNTQGELVSEE